MKNIDKLLKDALMRRDSQAAQQALEQGADPNLKVREVPVLHIAALRADVPLVEALLSRGADPDIQNYTGRSILHMLAETGCTPAHLEIANHLIKAGADVNTKNRSFSPAIDRADYFMNADLVKLLADAGATSNHELECLSEKNCRQR